MDDNKRSTSYSAMEIAKYVIDKCTKDGQEVSNLQLQKILYYIQLDFLKSGSVAFSDEIEAWKFGPVVPSVYRRFCAFGGTPISWRYEVDLPKEITDRIDPIIEEKRQKEPWDLVHDTHQPDKAWAIIYRDGEGERHVIPKDLIKSKG